MQILVSIRKKRQERLNMAQDVGVVYVGRMQAQQLAKAVGAKREKELDFTTLYGLDVIRVKRDNYLEVGV